MSSHRPAPTASDRHRADAVKRATPWLLLCVALGLLLAWLGLVWQPTRASAGAAALAVVQRDELPAGGDFTLRGPDGRVALADHRGQVVVVYFGYTFCPDVCPTSLALLAEALSTLKSDELASVKSLFISVDPERDTPAVLKVYAPFFHPNISGISGTPQELAVVAGQYGARYMKQKANADGNYTVDHSSYTYIIGSDGKLAARLPHAAPPDDIVRAIRAQLARPRQAG